MAAAVKRAFAGSVGIVTACLMVGLLGVVAVTRAAVFTFRIPGHVIPSHSPIAAAIVIPAKARIKSGGVNPPPESTSRAVQLTWARQPCGRQDYPSGAW